MSDNLRDRIADALEVEGAPASKSGLWAEAVIRELGLKADGCPCTQRGPNCAHRYVTEWETDNDGFLAKHR